MNLSSEEISAFFDFTISCKNASPEEILKKIEENPRVFNINGHDFGDLNPHTTENFVYDCLPPLYYAVEGNNIPVIKLLIEMGANADFEILGRNNIFSTLCSTGNIEMIELILPKLEGNKKLIQEGLECATIDRLDVVQYFFDTLAENNEKFQKNYEFFYGAFLNVCDVEYWDDDKSCNIEYNENFVVRLFIENIDNKKLEYRRGFFEKGLTLCSKKFDIETMLMMFNHCDPNFSTEDFDPIIFHILNHRRYDFLELTFDFYDYKITNRYGKTPLIFICGRFSSFAFYFFKKILKKSDIYTEDNQGHTALYYLKERDLQEYISYFEKD